MFPYTTFDYNSELYPVYANMDKSGEILLQTIAMLAGVDHKKSNLPQSLNKHIYEDKQNEAGKLLNNLGKLLTNRLGMRLNFTGENIPYDSIFPPMALVYSKLEKMGLKGKKEGDAYTKLEKWFVASILSLRYQEGVHSKQSKDREDMENWLENDKEVPQFIEDAKIPNLKIWSPDGAIGKFLRCLMFKTDLIDPLTHSNLKVASSTIAKRHIFPTKYLKDIKDWNKGDKSNLALNIMIVEKDTNAEWLDHDPKNQIDQSKGTEKKLKDIYKGHFISENEFKIMKRSKKKKILTIF